jgi:hypothetical protein
MVKATLDIPFNEYYYDGIKRFLYYMLESPQYVCCERIYTPEELEGISRRYKKFVTTVTGERDMYFLNKNYIGDSTTFFANDEVFNLDLRKIKRNPEVHFKVDVMLLRHENNRPHFSSATIPGLEINRNMQKFVYENTGWTEKNSIKAMLDLISGFSFDEILYSIHNEVPLFIQ